MLNFHQSEPKKDEGASSYKREPREHRTSSKKEGGFKRGWCQKVGCQEGRASRSHLLMERGELNVKDRLPFQRTLYVWDAWRTPEG